MNHPLTSISTSAKIAPNVEIGPFTFIGDNVIIGEGSIIGSNVTICADTIIGKNVQIFPCAVIGGIPQDLKYKGEKTSVEIGDNTTIREYVTINKGTTSNLKTIVGKNCFIMAYSHIGHDCSIGDNCVLSNNCQIAGHVKIGDWVWIAGVTAIHQFVTIGQHAYIAGGSLVSKDVPPYIKAVRNPLSYGGINSVGLKRRGFSQEKINHILDIYRIIFNKSLNTSQALQFIEEEVKVTDERDEIVEFIRNCSRGIIRKYLKGTANEDLNFEEDFN